MTAEPERPAEEEEENYSDEEGFIVRLLPSEPRERMGVGAGRR